MPSFKIIGLLVLEKKIFKGFYHIWAWRPSWSCDLDHLYKLSFPLPKEAPHTIWLWLAKRFQRRRCLNIVDNDNATTTDARAGVYYKLTLWAWWLRWAKNAGLMVWSFMLHHHDPHHRPWGQGHGLWNFKLKFWLNFLDVYIFWSLAGSCWYFAWC